jgi:HAD superfamily hydrolase (TIGR01509 family)
VTDAVLFDMDGVLLDSFDAWAALMSATATQLGYPPVTRDVFKTAFGQPTEDDVAMFFPKHTVQTVEDYYDVHFAEHAHLVRVLPGAREIFDDLDSRGILIAVITNTSSAIARPVLETLALDPHALVTATDVARPKPAPDEIFRACEVLGVEPWDVLVVGDSAFDKQAAAAAGVPFAGIGGVSGNFTIARLDEVRAIVDGTPD